MFKINNYDWEIKKTSPNHPALARSNGEFAWGSCDKEALTIYLSESIPSYKLKKVLCHEITHAAMFSYGVFMTYDQEELVADLIATYGEEIINITNKIFKKIKGRY